MFFGWNSVRLKGSSIQSRFSEKFRERGHLKIRTKNISDNRPSEAELGIGGKQASSVANIQDGSDEGARVEDSAARGGGISAHGLSVIADACTSRVVRVILYTSRFVRVILAQGPC